MRLVWLGTTIRKTSPACLQPICSQWISTPPKTHLVSTGWLTLYFHFSNADSSIWPNLRRLRRRTKITYRSAGTTCMLWCSQRSELEGEPTVGIGARKCNLGPLSKLTMSYNTSATTKRDRQKQQFAVHLLQHATITISGPLESPGPCLLLEKGSSNGKSPILRLILIQVLFPNAAPLFWINRGCVFLWIVFSHVDDQGSCQTFVLIAQWIDLHFVLLQESGESLLVHSQLGKSWSQLSSW